MVESNFNITRKTLIAIVVSRVVLLHIAVNVSLSLSSVLSCRPLPWSCRPLPCCPLPLSSRPLPLSLCHLLPSVSPLLLGGGMPWFFDLFVIGGDWWDAVLFCVFPRRIFGEVSVFLRKRVFFTMTTIVRQKKAVSNPITMVSKQHIWVQPSTHDGWHTNMLGADVVRCIQYIYKVSTT